MIDQELAKNILNNLLSINLTREGTEQEADQALGSDYVINGTKEGGKLSLQVKYIEVDEENSTLKGKYDDDGITGEPEIATVVELGEFDSEREANDQLKTRERRFSTLEPSSLKFNERTLSCPLYISKLKVSEVQTGLNEYNTIFPIGVSTENLETLVAEVSTLSEEGKMAVVSDVAGGVNLLSSLTSLPGKVSSKASEFSKEVLRGLPMYAGSGQKNFYEYASDEGSIKASPKQVVKKFKYVQWSLQKVGHTYMCEYSKSGKPQSIQKTFYYYYWKKEEKEKEITLSGWYYSQEPSTTSFFPNKAYLGLFTDYNPQQDNNNINGMPNPDGTKFREPPYKDGDKATYQRMSLHNGLFTSDYVFNKIEKVDVDAQSYPGYAHLDNKEIIMFPEILNEEGWGNIYGFGVFENEIPTEGEKPYFWGEVNGAPVATSVNHVPLFRPLEFEVFLG